MAPTPSVLQRAFLKGLRAVSPRWRAHTELFVEPYRSWVDWMSGLGEGGRVLYAITRMTRPSVIVEIGSARGNSTCSFALACAENDHGMVYAIDPHSVNEWTDVGTAGNTYDFLRQRLKDYDLEHYCTVVRQTSDAAAKDWKRHIDLLFIDGDHSLAGVRADFESFAPWVNEDGMIVFHDSAWERDRSWESYRGERWYREDMGVPMYLADLQQRGYQGATFMPVPGMTFIHPRPGGFDFLRRRPSLQAASARS